MELTKQTDGSFIVETTRRVTTRQLTEELKKLEKRKEKIENQIKELQELLK